MARVNVEQKALTDPRFDLLGRFLESTRHDALGRMILVWNECQERDSYSLPERLVGAIMGDREGASWVVEADLAVWVNKETVRIKGTEGRVEWLAVKRETAKRNGKLGGRPVNPSRTDDEPTSVSPGFSPETPPAPAPAPAPAPETKKTKDKIQTPRPTLAEVVVYFDQRGKGLDPEAFFAHYEANGWVQSNGRPIKKWQAAVITWEKNAHRFASPSANGQHQPRKETPEEIMARIVAKRDAK